MINTNNTGKDYLNNLEKGAIETSPFSGYIVRCGDSIYTETEIRDQIAQVIDTAFQSNKWTDASSANKTLDLLDRKIEEKKASAGILETIFLIVSSLFGAPQGSSIKELIVRKNTFNTIDSLSKEMKNNFLGRLYTLHSEKVKEFEGKDDLFWAENNYRDLSVVSYETLEKALDTSITPAKA